MDSQLGATACRTCIQFREIFAIHMSGLFKTSELTRLDVTIEEMLASAATGCDFCVSFSKLTIHRFDQDPPGRPHGLRFTLFRDAMSISPVRPNARLVDLPPPDVRFVIVAEPGTPAEDYYPNRLLPTDLSDAAVVHQARQWISSCLMEHVEGPQRGGLPYLPRRVVDVWNLRLHISRVAERSTYAALSYCWGGSQSYITTKSSIKFHEKHLDLEALPATIRDAIRTTQDLGLRYIWIDALCIMQDCPEDKELEIAAMNKIYKDATVTIAAASASNVYAGFLGPRPYPPFAELTICCPNNRHSKVLLVEEEVYAEECEDFGPLYQRGWALQERILSPRLLIYGQKELVWQCHQIDWAQVTKSHLKVLPWNWTIRLPTPIYYGQQRDSSSVMRQPVLFDWDLWKKIVLAYSRCNLTLSEDKLPALAGVATELHNIWGVDYLAGLWRPYFITQMCWFLERRGECQNAAISDIRYSALFPQSVGTSTFYRAPSWSWAALDGIVRFRGRGGQGEDARLISWRIEPLSQKAPFGQVKRGMIEIEGLVFPLTDIIEILYSFNNTSIDIDGERLASHLNRIEQDKVMVVVLLNSRPTLGVTSQSHYPVVEGLFLETVKDGLFRRIGYWETLGPQLQKQLSSNIPRRVIKII